MTIKVESVQASVCAITGKRIDTLLCEYPLDIHAQLLTHGALSKNSSSCRAIPISKAVEQLRANPAKKMWTAKQKGMQGQEIRGRMQLAEINTYHRVFMEQAINAAVTMDKLGVHKQNAGRYLTPFQNIKIVLTSTEWENWDWLRNDKDAQPEIRELAKAIYAAREQAEPLTINAGEWHVPFVVRCRNVAGELEYFTEDEGSFTQVTTEQAKNISMSCSAQTSYRNLDNSLVKADDIIGKLFNGKKIHASPSEHQATPIPEEFHGAVPDQSLEHIMASLPAGITALDRRLQFRSGNFTNWIQLRQLIPGHDHAETLRDEEDAEHILETLMSLK